MKGSTGQTIQATGTGNLVIGISGTNLFDNGGFPILITNSATTTIHSIISNTGGLNATGSGTLAMIYHQFPPAITKAASRVLIASPIADYFQFAMLAEARRKQGEGAMPEMAAHFDQRVALYEQVMQNYWGGDE